jgi:serine phosphatase RsbU (regulator of sigma subunit)
LLPSAAYQSETVMLSAGASVVLLSDGISEAVENASRTTREAVVEALSSLRPEAGVEAQAEAVMRMGRSGRGPAGVDGWQDDRTVVVLGRGAAAGRATP